jgi:hypothetical protein
MPHGSQNTTPGQSATHFLPLKVATLVVLFLLRLAVVAEHPKNIIHFKSPHRSMIVIDVRVNGRGPYPFLLDTGATSSAVDPELSTVLHLSVAPGARLASWTDTSDVRRVVVEDLSLGSIDSGPLNVLVQPLLEFKAFDPHLRGVLGQDVLLRSNFLIDNRRHLIQFDDDAALLPQLTGERVSIVPVRTRSGDLEPRLISVSVQTDRNAEPLHLLLDSGADMVVLQPRSAPPPSVPKGAKWIADENGKHSAATTFHTTLSVGAEAFSAECWIGDTGLKSLAIDGLLPTGSFNRLYIANQGSFVIFEPGRIRHRPPPNSERASLNP